MKQRLLQTREYIYTALYEPAREGGYHVTVPLLRGLVTYGRTFEEAREMVRDAIRCHLEAMRKDKEKIPQESSLLQEKISVKL